MLRYLHDKKKSRKLGFITMVKLKRKFNRLLKSFTFS